MSTKGKADRTEREVKKRLEDGGWRVEKSVHTRMSHQDFFGMFDLIGSKRGEKIKFIQVKCNRARGINKFMEKLDWIPFEHVDVEFWIKYDYKGFRVLRLNNGKKETILDERR